MNMYPPLMPSEVRSQAIWIGVSTVLAIISIAVLLWQWRMPPKSWIAVLWGSFLLICVIAVQLNLQWHKQLVSHAGLYLLGLTAVTATGGLIRNSIRVDCLDRRVLGLLAIYICYVIFTPPQGHSGEPVWRSQCKNNLKLIGLAIHNQAESRMFAPTSGTPEISWRVSILPFIEAGDLAKGYDFNQPWDSAGNREVGLREPAPYRCAAHRELTRSGAWAITDYALLTGHGTIFPKRTTPFDFQRINDGTSNTILAVECPGLRIPWTEPREADVSQVTMDLNRLGADGNSPSVASSFHSHSAHVLLADGSVRTLSPQISSETLKALTTANGQEQLGEF